MKWKPAMQSVNEGRSWFAWRPVRLEDGTWIWLEYVLRSARYINFPHSFGPKKYFYE